MALFVGIGAVVLLSNHNRDIRTPSGLPVVGDIQQYNDVMGQAANLAAAPLQDYELGKQLTPEETAKIRQASKLVDAANEFKPSTPGVAIGQAKFAPFFLAGKLHAAVGEYEKADQMLRQGLYNAQNVRMDRSGVESVIDAMYERSRVLFQMGDYKDSYVEARAASKAAPAAPQYLVQLAKAALQLKKTDEAKEAILAALAIDPGTPGADMLAKYLHVKIPKQ